MAEYTLHFKLFDGFFFRTAPNEAWISVGEVLPGVSGRKSCLFLEYLVINHDRSISAEELMDTFWPEGASDDPAGALKQMLYKARNLLKKMFPHVEKPLVNKAGQFAWNKTAQLDVDLEHFEQHCKHAKMSSDPSQQAQQLLSAIELYGSGLKSGDGLNWLESLRIYYHTLFLDACRAVLDPLQLEGQWIRIVSICEKACELEPCGDEFMAYMMQALIMLGHPQQAVTRYEHFRDLLRKEYGAEPSPDVQRMYQMAIQSETGSGSIDGQNLFQLLESGQTGSAFLCNFSVFTRIVDLERRHIARNHLPSSLVMFQLETSAGLCSATDLHRLEQVLLTGLRSYDAISQLNNRAFILLLSGVDTDIAQVVAQRLQDRFNTTYKLSDSRVTSQILPLNMNANPAG